MEQLLAVEIIRDHCRCCLKSFSSIQQTRVQVTPQLQEVFLGFLNEELENGKICSQCNEYLEMFYHFKKEILSFRHNFGEELTVTDKQANCTFDDQEEPDEEDIINEENCFTEELGSDTFSCSKTKTDPIKSTVKIRSRSKRAKTRELAEEQQKQTKLEKLLDQYNVQYLSNDNERPSKAPKIFCPICSKALSILSFSTHLKIHQGGREYNFMCEICSSKCVSNAELVVHRRRHTKEKPFQCDSCPMRFFNCKKNLIAHFRSFHLNIRKVKQAAQQCGICLKKFAPEYLIHQHMKNAHPNGINDGVKVNPETNHYHCETCGGQYRTRRYFDIHICIEGANDGPTQSECLICFLKFSSRLETMKHIREIHAEKLDNEKWRCLVCDKVLLDKIVLHVESVHTSKGSKCGLCNKELKNRRCLRNHIYVMHQNGSKVRKERRIMKTLSKKLEMKDPTSLLEVLS